MKTLLVPLSLALATLAAGCATPSSGDGAIATQAEARTGTNISRRDREGVKSISREELEREMPAPPSGGRTGRAN